MQTDSTKRIQLLHEDLNDEVYRYKQENTYAKGDGVFLENKSIILDRRGEGEPIYLKTWYVCIQANDETAPQSPEDNPSYWLKDGCTKKISGCRKRFAAQDATTSFWTKSDCIS